MVEHMKFAILFLHIFLATFSAHGTPDGCQATNLITASDSPFQKIPVYDQKDTNLCYAYSAAQLMDYHLIKNGSQNRSIHPAWVALSYARSKNKTGLYIGHTKEAIDSMRVARNCHYNSVSNALLSWSENRELPETSILKLIENFSTKAKEELIQGPSSLDPSLTPVEMLSRLMLPACPEEGREKIKLPAVSKFNFRELPTDEAFESFIKKRLDEKTYPVSIAYCSKVWKDPEYDGIHLNLALNRDSLSGDCNYHESLVVGKKMLNGKCQFLIRNSLGDGYWAGSNQVRCLCKNKQTGEYADDCSAATHPSPQFMVEGCWLDSIKLARNTGVVTFME